jgi:hypothetical protein
MGVASARQRLRLLRTRRRQDVTVLVPESAEEELQRAEEIAKSLGFEEVEDDGWGFRGHDTGTAPVGAPGPPGPGVSIEKASS